MKAFLMHPGCNFDGGQPLLPHAPALIQDLALDALLAAMARDDDIVLGVAKTALLTGTTDVDTILYRQRALRDCIANPAVARRLYAIAGEAIQREKKNFWGIGSRFPGSMLHRSVEVLRDFVELLRELRGLADKQSGSFTSEAFTALFAVIKSELDDAFFGTVAGHLKRLKFRHGVLISAELGDANHGAGYVLRRPLPKPPTWFERLFAARTSAYTYRIDPRDETGARALSELSDRGVGLVASALAQSTDHILGFFTALRTELAFYIGCLNLQEALVRKGEPVSFPQPMAVGERTLAFTGLYDACLSLELPHRVVGNDLDAGGALLVIITGANQGGKSTFLRSIGLAQLMMQCGMFTPAEHFRSTVCEGLFAHYKREEDASMTSGKFDEELSRMSGIVDALTTTSVVLFNESFASTNEREGAEIAQQIVSGLLERGIRVFFVTHMYAFSSRFAGADRRRVVFLRADRQDDGRRTFKLTEAPSLQTSHGIDLYDRIFGDERPHEVTETVLS